MSTRSVAVALTLAVAALLGGCTTPQQRDWQRESSVVVRDAGAVADRLDEATQNIATAADKLATAATASAEAVAVITPKNAAEATQTAEAINRVAAAVVEAVRPLSQAAQTIREQPEPADAETIARTVLAGLQGVAGVGATAATGNPAAGVAASGALGAIGESIIALVTLAGVYFGGRGMAKAKAAETAKSAADADWDDGYRHGQQARD